MVSLKCGRLALENNTLKADNRKGNIQVIFDLAGLCHFIWTERDVSSTNVDYELDIVIIPGEAVFEMVSFVPPILPRCHLSALTSSHPTYTLLPFITITDSRKTGLHSQILRRTIQKLFLLVTGTRPCRRLYVGCYHYTKDQPTLP
jgi:hypothetical protein